MLHGAVPSVFPGDAAKGLLILHALAASVLVGASTHQAVVAVQLLRGRVHLQRLARLYARIIGVAELVSLFVSAGGMEVAREIVTARAGGQIDPNVAKQILGYVAQYSPAADQMVKAYCH